MENKDFTLYPEASELNKLGFEEPCLAFYNGTFLESTQYRFYDCSMMDIGQCFLAPTYSQAFRWFREKYNCHHTIKLINEKYVGIAYSSVVNFSIDEFNTYEEAELACLRKLIETVKENGN
jgi:hypothetical protein